MLKRAALLTLAAAVLAMVALLLPAPSAHASTTPRRLIALRWAEAQAGKPYIWGGTGPWGFDCSGLVMSAWRHAGITLPRTTYEMLSSWHLRWVPASQRQPGMLAFYGPGHVELVTRSGTFGAQQPGTDVGWHHPSGWWMPTAYYKVIP